VIYGCLCIAISLEADTGLLSL